MGQSSQPPRFDFLRRTLALGCASLVFALAVFAASPSLHERLHAAPQAAADDGCAVALFASGVSLAVPVLRPFHSRPRGPSGRPPLRRIFSWNPLATCCSRSGAPRWVSE